MLSTNREGGSVDEAPLRAELFSISQLERHARTLAGWHKVGPANTHDYQLLARLDDNERVLVKAYAFISEAVGRDQQITPAAEWFFDNYHLIQEQIRLARRHLPRGYSRELPHRVNGPGSGSPRVYDLAIELISHAHGHVDRDELRAFVAAYQSVQPLVLGELWAIPIMLRLALIENLRRVVGAVTAGRRDRESARVWAERMLEVAAATPARVVLVLARMIHADPPLSDAFVTELTTRLQGQGPALVFPLSWLEQRLAERGQTVKHAYQLTTQNQAADQVAIGNCIGSLRFLSATDWRAFVESMSLLERILEAEPTGVYQAMEFATRDRYRHVVERIARQSTLSEEAVAQTALSLAASRSEPRQAHIGYFLVDQGRPELERAVLMRPRPSQRLRSFCRPVTLQLYVAAVIALVISLCALAAGLFPELVVAGTLSGPARLWLWGLVAFCAFHPAVAIAQWLSTLLVEPTGLPRLDFSEAVPPEHAAAVAVPSMLTDPQGIDELVEQLELRYLSNRDPHIWFGLLTDFRDAEAETLSTDAALLARAEQRIEELNRKYAPNGEPAPFFLCHRARRFNPSEGVWMGWERKRGKLEDFNALLRGEPERFQLTVGDIAALQSVAYVIVLDSDTDLPRDSARQLIGALAHPLNQPVWHPTEPRIIAGYSILQPRVATTMLSVVRSRFAQLFAGEAGVDPYTRAVSDMYQDTFGEGSFVGKGIYAVDAMRRACSDRFPDNRVLSHDLLEGAYGRSGLVSEVVLYEDYPGAHLADVARRTRWIRGDWQIARWLLRAVPGATKGRFPNPISRLSQLKILDNLRRSLVPVGLFVLLVMGLLSASMAVLSLLVVLTSLFLPGLLMATAAITRKPAEVPHRQHMREIAASLGRHFVREGFALAMLPFDAAVNLVAIGRACVRTVVTRRLMLEWRTAGDTARAGRTNLRGSYASMWILPATAIVLPVLIILTGSPYLLVALPLCALWLAAPALSWWLSAPLHAAQPRLQPEDTAFLHNVARRTWRFFETLITTESHYLPPDNIQEDPAVGIAHRTSPTNIGCALAANLAAYDFGYLAAGELIDRTEQTCDSLDKLVRYRGHFFNWYDTLTLEPLRPMYVSTVDSGNLTGLLLTLAAGLRELGTHPVLRSETAAGVRDTLSVLSEVAAEPVDTAQVRQALESWPRTASGTRDRLLALSLATQELTAEVESRGDAELSWWAAATAKHVAQASAELCQLAPWAALPVAPPRDSLRGLAALLDQNYCLADTAALAINLLPEFERAEAADQLETPAGAALDWLREARAAVELGSERAAQRLAQLAQLARRCQELADHDVSLLYDRRRHLLSIGYNVIDHRLDAGFYDLLASEARLASYVAIAQGKLPQEHWFHLGRQLTSSAGGPALLSWSGSMFEYLMPLLIMPTYPGTLLSSTYRAVVKRQIDYGREHGVAWGVSESGYNKTDKHLNYQYHAFGVPGLGYKRGLGEELVFAPYASVMALMVAPEAAVRNLRRLASEGLLGGSGFYEAVDYTPSRLPPGKTSAVVRSYMAHHQGMAFLALVYLLKSRPMQRRFCADPVLRATDLLLQERVPRTPPIVPHPLELAQVRSTSDAEPNLRIFTTPNTATPEVTLLSNGRYHVAVTNAGAGYSRWNDLAVTRWHEDPTADHWGSFCYLRDTASGSFWSAAHQPTLRRADSYEAIFSPGRAEFRRRDEGLETHVEISVSPEDDVELRRVSITNLGPTARTIEFTSFAEVVLATPAADAAHPAFSNLFVETEFVDDHSAILCTRRPRSAGEHPPFMLHMMTLGEPAAVPPSFETSRTAFLGRGRSAADPAAMHRETLGNSQGAVLDPIVSVRNTVSIGPDRTARIHIVTGIATTRAGALALIEKYRDRHLAERVFELSWTQSQVMQRQLDATTSETQLYDKLASNIIYANPRLRAPESVIARNHSGQSGLWAYGISGDLPIVLVRISDLEHVGLVRDLVRAHTYWAMRGLRVDLVLWNEDPTNYRQSLQESIMAVIATQGDTQQLDRPGGIFVRCSDQMSEEASVLIRTVARVILTDSAGSLAAQLDRTPRTEARAARFVPRVSKESWRPKASQGPALAHPHGELTQFNGLGGFAPGGREYIITTTRSSKTPAPWSNVLANPFFGSVVSESGGAYTWCENAHSYRLTPWHNDPLSDPSGEALYLRDEDDGRFWSPTPLPAGGRHPYTTRHGFGYSVFEYTNGGIRSELTTFVASDAPVKFWRIALHNQSGRRRRLTLTCYCELVLGAQRASTAPHIVTEVDFKTNALFARNSYREEFAGRVAFLDCNNEIRAVTGDRKEFLGRNGDRARPHSMGHASLSGRVGAGLDPCLAMQVTLELDDGESREIAFTLGSGRDLADARLLVQRFRGAGPTEAALEQVKAYWAHTLGAVQVSTPDPALDLLANGWLVYQVLACRMWARSGYYQSGGAFGFRDQLQDAAALIHAEPKLVREHIIRAAAHQFPEGDVQHWWHPPAGRGVRTRISDDYLWLPNVVSRYVEAVGDTALLDETVEFIEGRPVQPDEDSYYDLPTRSDQAGTVYEHCVRAVKHGLNFGAHGLPLMGSGDWNDGMNLVGDQGRGESVWLGFFLYDVLLRFARLARERGDTAFADSCVGHSKTLQQNLEQHGWDGEWYRRAYFDDGTPLGSKSSPECMIDSLPQSFAVLSGAGRRDRAKLALRALDQRLVDRELQVIKLFEPPFDNSDLDPGYVKGYVPGVRENGGQYTHAAVWAAMAFAAAGDGVRAWELFQLINPINHGSSPDQVARYMVEPYVVAADVYTNPRHAGRGGWTWYTGSAGWMYRLITESLLGLHLEVDRLRISPIVPPSWEAFDIQYRFRGTTHHIHVVNLGGGRTVTRVVSDGIPQTSGTIPLHTDGQEHHSEVTLGSPAEPTDAQQAPF